MDISLTGESDVALLWQRWKMDGDLNDRNSLFLHYGTWVKKVAGKLYTQYRTPQTEWVDFVQLASLALLGAISRFDPGKGVRFESYAYPRIKGEVINGIECFFKDKNRVNHEQYALRILARFPELKPSEDPLDTIIELAVGLAFGQFLESGMVDLTPEVDPFDSYSQSRIGAQLWELVDQLPAKQRMVMVAHYRHHVDFVDIASTMKLTRARVSQLHSEALSALRALFQR